MRTSLYSGSRTKPHQHRRSKSQRTGRQFSERHAAEGLHPIADFARKPPLGVLITVGLEGPNGCNSNLRSLIFLRASYLRRPLSAPSSLTANQGSRQWANPFVLAPSGLARLTREQHAPTDPNRTKLETAHEPSSRVESSRAAAAIDSLFLPRKAKRPPRAAAHACAVGLQHGASLAAPSARASARFTAHPSNHSRTCLYTMHRILPGTCLCWFLEEFLDRF